MQPNPNDSYLRRKIPASVPEPEGKPIISKKDETPKKEAPKNDDFNEYEFSNDPMDPDADW